MIGDARREDELADSYASIGEDVTLFAGAKLIGAVPIGDYAVIGANAVVTREVPAGRIAVGVPARILQERAASPDPVATSATN